MADRPATVNALRQAPFDFTNPPIRAAFEVVACVDGKGKPSALLVVRVEPSDLVHEASGGECYLRVGDESRKLTYSQRRELEYDRGQRQYDGLPAGADFSHLDARLVRQYARQIGLPADPKRVLAARSLLTLGSQVTNAGYLLFGKRPQDLFPQAHVRILRFLTAERGTGSRLGLDDSADSRIDGPVPHVVERATKVVDELVPRRRSLAASGRFEAVPVVPPDAWLEGLVNAVIHRSYSLAGDHIRVEIYPNRIEIESPGRFPGLANPRHPLQVSRFARNRLVLAALPRLEPTMAARLPAGSQQVLDALRAAGTPLGTGELAQLLDLSRPPVLRKLRALEHAGLVRWVGKSQTDPRATWTLA